MNKVTLLQLYKDTFRRSTLVSIPHLADLLETPGSEYTKWEIFYKIVDDALNKFERYFPLYRIQKMYIEVNNEDRTSTLSGNFEAYLKGVISEDQICILPAAISGLSTSYYTASTYPLRNFRYTPPVITDCWYASGIYYANCTCKRPFYEEYDEVTKKPTDRCAVYFMNYKVDTQWSIFYDEVYLSLCRYLMNTKKNMLLQNMPIELFQGLEEDYGNLNTSQETIYQQSIPEGYYMI